MNFYESLFVAWANLKANLVRSLLSMLGIVIGTASVILVVSMVNGTRLATLDEMSVGKSDLLVLRPKYSPESGRFGKLSLDDIERLKKIPKVKAAWPELNQQMMVKGPFGRSQGTVTGVETLYSSIYQLKLVNGRFFEEKEMNSRPRICVISDKFAKKIFGYDHPIGGHVRVEKLSFEVVGVTKEEERLVRAGQGTDVLVPLPTYFKLVQNPAIYSAQVRSETGAIDDVKNSIEVLLKGNPRQANLIDIEDPRTYLKDIERWARDWLRQMAIIAGISLLVGGVGLMNVMLTTVVERTHEIGVRKALGASSRAIRRQFLIEAVSLSGVGGACGVLTGILLSVGIGVLSKGKVLVSILPASLVVSFVFSLAIGLLFGLFPASKAAHLSPVEALRYE